MMLRLPCPPRRLACVAAALVALQALSACAPLVVGGAVMGGLVVVDRRTSGTQLEDQGIELKAINRVREVTGGRGHYNITSYNRVALITGEAATDADRAAVEQAVRQIENVRSLVNEVAVMEASSITSRSGDLVTTGRVKAAFIDANDLQATVFKVVTERGVVHLMGRVTEREANRATEVARTVGGVAKVVKVFDVITEAELAKLQPAPAKP
ncbi:BON domain-containing protein [Ideonella sp. A 288]|uniref:BON domain-containing protein n=1 Tax=Ideonella sp. A 288 TaxID=1962181 RepID=UPI000B4AC0BD|nr:BON domain-containing protein [Ideonella sp. A 288]